MIGSDTVTVIEHSTLNSRDKKLDIHSVNRSFFNIVSISERSSFFQHEENDQWYSARF